MVLKLRRALLLGFLLGSLGLASAQAPPLATTAYTISWTPVPGTVTLSWLNAPAGTNPTTVTGDASGGSATIAVPDGTWYLSVVIVQTGQSKPAGTAIKFSTGAKPVLYNPGPPLDLQVI